MKDKCESGSISQIVWISSFGLAFGAAESKFDSFDLVYARYVLAILLNVVLMLNMIVSIFGGSFDKFQLLSNYYNYREMAKVILELQNIFPY
jgi:hypothetical protein